MSAHFYTLWNEIVSCQNQTTSQSMRKFSPRNATLGSLRRQPRRLPLRLKSPKLWLLWKPSRPKAARNQTQTSDKTWLTLYMRKARRTITMNAQESDATSACRRATHPTIAQISSQNYCVMDTRCFSAISVIDRHMQRALDSRQNLCSWVLRLLLYSSRKSQNRPRQNRHFTSTNAMHAILAMGNNDA